MISPSWTSSPAPCSPATLSWRDTCRSSTAAFWDGWQLDELALIQPKRILPGHGPVIDNWPDVRTTEALSGNSDQGRSQSYLAWSAYIGSRTQCRAVGKG